MWGRCSLSVAVISLCLSHVLDLTRLTASHQRVNQNFWSGCFAFLPPIAGRGDFEKRHCLVQMAFLLGYRVE